MDKGEWNLDQYLYEYSKLKINREKIDLEIDRELLNIKELEIKINEIKEKINKLNKEKEDLNKSITWCESKIKEKNGGH